MKRNNFFTKKQYGFISGRSTALQLLEVLDKWTDALDLGYSIGCVYMDYKIIKSSDDSTILQEDLTKLEEWSDTWLLRFHPDKCKHMHIGKKNGDNSYSLHRKSLEKVIEEKDIGVVIDSDLTFEKHINEKVNKANQMFATF